MVQLPISTSSNSLVVKQGVPQGSILLFILFANDLILYLNKIPNVLTTCHADDTNILIVSGLI